MMTESRSYDLLRKMAFLALLGTAFIAHAQTISRYPALAIMSDTERDALEAQMEVLAKAAAALKFDADEARIQLTVTLDKVSNKAYVDLVSESIPVEDDVGEEWFARSVTERIEPITNQIEGLEGIVWRRDGYRFWDEGVE